MAETSLDYKAVIAQLGRSPHGELIGYAPTALDAARKDPEFFAHFLAWNHQKGAIRDSKVALPILALAAPPTADPADTIVFQENALAHLADLKPKQFLQAMQFARQVKAPDRLLRRLVTRYLRDLEADYRAWERTAIMHREALRTLYGRWHVAPGGVAGSRFDTALMKRKSAEGRFAAVRTLAALTAVEINAALRRFQLPFLIARGALGARAKEPLVLMALMSRMTATELVTSAKALKRLGVLEVPELRAQLEEALAKAGKKQRKTAGAVLKTTKAAEVLEEDGDVASGKLAVKLRVLQEKQLDHIKTIEGDWAIFGDCSHSMAPAIEITRKLAALMARLVKGKVHVIFQNTTPRYFDATGMSYEELLKQTKMIAAGGGTILGVGLDYLLQRKIAVDGIALVTDGGHNPGHTPHFSTTYAKYVKALEVEPTVYYYRLQGDPDHLTGELQGAKIQFEGFDLRTVNLDRYSLPDTVQTMRVNRYSLLDEIREVPLRTLDEALKRTQGMGVLRGTGQQTTSV